MAVRILIVDDFAAVRQGLHMFLALDPELQVVGEAENGADGLELARALRPDVVLMDLVMPAMDGVSSITAIRQELPDVEVIALTSTLQDALISGAIRAGASGYVLKDTEADELRRAIKAAAAGRVQLSSGVVPRLLREPWASGGREQLTPRERDVLRLLASGLSDEEIAAQLSVSEETVKVRVRRILSKLNVLSRTQAVVCAVRLGLGPTAPPPH